MANSQLVFEQSALVKSPVYPHGLPHEMHLLVMFTKGAFQNSRHA